MRKLVLSLCFLLVASYLFAQPFGHKPINKKTTSGGAGLYWDAANARLGIGTTLPSGILDVSGNIYAGTKSSGDVDVRLYFYDDGSFTNYIGSLISHILLRIFPMIL